MGEGIHFRGEVVGVAVALAAAGVLLTACTVKTELGVGYRFDTGEVAPPGTPAIVECRNEDDTYRTLIQNSHNHPEVDLPLLYLTRNSLEPVRDC